MTVESDLDEKFEINFRNMVDLIIAILIIVDTFLLILLEFSNLDSIVTQYIINFDYLVCFVLFCEFMFRFIKAEDRKLFFKDKQNWFAIVAMIPVNFFVFRFFRYFRIIKVFPLLERGYRHFSKFIKETHLDWSLGIIILAISAGTVSFYLLEYGINGNIHSIWDSFWYVMPTIITAGSSDITPNTQGGKIVAILLMTTGIIFFGLFTASIASWFVKKAEQSNENNKKKELKELKELVLGIQSEINELKEILKK